MQYEAARSAHPHSERIAITIALWDGSEHVVHVRANETVGQLQQRITSTLHLLRPALACNGELLHDTSTPVGRLASHQLTAWCARYTRAAT